MTKTCDKCGNAVAVKEAFCPVSELMGQRILWRYCQNCHLEDLKIAEKVKATLSKEELAECAKG